MASIPTTYRGIRMRSRLEAKWACVFDQLSWQWEYEPIDMDGWIPDFVIHADPLILVDVKPIWAFDQKTGDKLLKAANPEEYELVILGAGPFSEEYDNCCIGWLMDDWSDGWELAVPMYPTIKPKVYGLAAGTAGWYKDRITGNYDGDHDYNPMTLTDWQEIWAEATNSSQWRP